MTTNEEKDYSPFVISHLSLRFNLSGSGKEILLKWNMEI
jgi:hypothetical protein